MILFSVMLNILICAPSVQVFCSGKVLYAGQAIGMVLARTREQALRAVPLVEIKYKEHKKPVLTIKEALEDPERVMLQSNFGPPTAFDSGNLHGMICVLDLKMSLDHCFFTEEMRRAETVVEGEFEIGNQYHFYMETIVASCVPVEDGMDVYCSTQDQDSIQSAVAHCVGIERAQ